jgi:hypothetical protein
MGLSRGPGKRTIQAMRTVYLFIGLCLPAVAGTISTNVYIQAWPTGCGQSSLNNPGELVASASCSAIGATVSASQNGWNASVSAGRNSDWRQGATTSATLSYDDSLIITGDTGSGFIQFGVWLYASPSAWLNYSFDSFSCPFWWSCPPPDSVTIPVTFGVPLDIHWDLHANGGCTGDGSCFSSSASASFWVSSITRADGSPSNGSLQTLDSTPEPSTILLTAIGAAAILTLRFRRLTSS